VRQRARSLAAALVLVFAAAAAAGADPVTGRLLLLQQCPGEGTGAPGQIGPRSAFLSALLTPLLTGLVGQGIETVGEKLTQEAQEASVDVVHRGDSFYRFRATEQDFGLAFGCLVVASRSARSSSAGLDGLARGYLPSPGALQAVLESAGYGPGRVPGILGVFDLKLSPERSALRLVPRFVAMDHSVRESKVDGKARTLTFEFLLETPAASRPFASVLVKIDGLLIGTPFVGPDGEHPQVSSPWFPPAPLDSGSAQRRSALADARGEMATRREAARLALAAASHLGDEDVAPYADQDPPCPPKQAAFELWARKHAALVEETAPAKSHQDARKVAALTAAETLFESCTRFRTLETWRSEDGLKDGDPAGPFDVTVTLKEFRKRPFAQFFGGVLSEGATQKGLTAAVLSGIDPATRARAEEEKERALLGLREDLESAVVAAEAARLAYDRAHEEDKAQRYLEMEAKKRTANRRARALGVPPPYPESGYWY
jgi:hypothetical protein